MSIARWKNNWEHIEFPITVYGIDPENALLNLPGYADKKESLRLADHLVFDGLSRTTYGPVLDTLKERGSMETEVNQRQVHIASWIDVSVYGDRTL